MYTETLQLCKGRHVWLSPLLIVVTTRMSLKTQGPIIQEFPTYINNQGYEALATLVGVPKFWEHPHSHEDKMIFAGWNFSGLGGCGYPKDPLLRNHWSLSLVGSNIETDQHQCKIWNCETGYSLANIKLEYTWMNQDVYFWPNFEVGWYIGHEVIPSRFVMRSTFANIYMYRINGNTIRLCPFWWFCNCHSV